MASFRCSRCKGIVDHLEAGPWARCPLCGTEVRPAVRVADWVVEPGPEAGHIGMTARTELPSAPKAPDRTMRLQEQRRYLAALDEVTGSDPGRSTTIAEVAEHVGRNQDDLRTPLSLQSLWETGYIEVGDDAVRLTPKGLWALGKWPPPE